MNLYDAVLLIVFLGILGLSAFVVDRFRKWGTLAAMGIVGVTLLAVHIAVIWVGYTSKGTWIPGWAEGLDRFFPNHLGLGKAESDSNLVAKLKYIWAIFLEFFFVWGAIVYGYVAEFFVRGVIPNLPLVRKQMRQRLLSTLLTCVSIILGMTLATSVMIMGRESRNVFAQSDYGFELLVGPKASPLQLVMNTIYHIDVSPGNIPYSLYEDIATGREFSEDGKKNQFRGMAAWAVPYAVGDSYKGRRIIGTSPLLFGANETGKPLPLKDEDGNSLAYKIPVYRQGTPYTFSEGHAFAGNKLEAVIGSNVAKQLGMTIGTKFKATHGVPTADFTPFDEHEVVWTIVGILNETHTANDNALFIPLLTFYAIFEHETGLEAINKIQDQNSTTPASQITPASAPASAAATTAAAETEPANEGYIQNPDGTITVKLPKKEWEISAILVHTRSPSALLDMQFRLRNLPDAIAASPADVMGKFFDTFLPKISLLLIIISTLVTVVAGVSIMVSIYNSVMARRREIAIMRALGATKERILAIVCLEAGLIGTIGAVTGLITGHLLTAVGALYMQRMFGTGLAWWRMGGPEFAYLAAVIGISLLAGLVPALKAYKTPVAENLVAS